MTQLWVILTFKDREDEDAPAREKNQKRVVIRNFEEYGKDDLGEMLGVR